MFVQVNICKFPQSTQFGLWFTQLVGEDRAGNEEEAAGNA